MVDSLPKGNVFIKRTFLSQQLKVHETLCSSFIPDGKFLLYHNGKPLLRVDKANTDQTIVWLTFQGANSPCNSIALHHHTNGMIKYCTVL